MLVDYSLIDPQYQRTPVNLAGGFASGEQQNRINKLGAILAGSSLDPAMAQYAQIDPIQALITRNDFYNKLALKSPESVTKSQVTQLEQLWKDNERSLREARSTSDREVVDAYTNLKYRLEAQLKELRPEVWGDVKIPGPGPKKEQTEQTKQSDAKPYSEMESEVKNKAVDADGVPGLDNISDLKKLVDDWRRESGIPTNDPRVKGLLSYIENKDAEFKSQAQEKREVTRFSAEQYNTYVEQSLPGVKEQASKLRDSRVKMVNAIEQYKRAPAGGAYVAMKNVLGDALSAADQAGVAGSTYDEGIFGKIMAKLGAASLTDGQAEGILAQSVEAYNATISDFESRFDTNSAFGRKAKQAFSIKKLSMPGTKPEETEKKKSGSKPKFRKITKEELEKLLGTEGGK